jgi:hypothetical protein
MPRLEEIMQVNGDLESVTDDEIDGVWFGLRYDMFRCLIGIWIQIE